MSISVKIIADSLTQHGDRLTTMILKYPRIIHSEFMTHRLFSRNSASSRAVPFKKMVESVKKNPFIPIKFQKEHPGMQGDECFEGKEHDACVKQWLAARDAAIKNAESLNSFKVTKQLCNRLLEPFMYHTVIITSSDYENFFSLRAEGAAEIHIQELAHKMLEAYNESEPQKLRAGEWHIPFGNEMDIIRIRALVKDATIESFNEIRIKIATARCARVSYLNYEGKDDYEADIALFDRLSKSGHFSPFEHCARVMTFQERDMWTRTIPDPRNILPYIIQGAWCGNFQGFIQLRKELPDENRKDNRVIKKTYEEDKKKVSSQMG
jgi:thymidylate synthase ThyX